MLNRQINLGILGFVVACVTISSQLLGAELTPYRLPSESSNPRPQSNQSVQRGMQQQSDAREEYYKNFAQKAQGLTQKEKNELISDFSAKQKNAQDKHKYDDARHYLRLIEILNTGGKK